MSGLNGGYYTRQALSETNDVATLLQKGVTIGAAKLVKRIHDNEFYAAWYPTQQFDQQEIFPIGFPLFHVGRTKKPGYVPRKKMLVKRCFLEWGALRRTDPRLSGTRATVPD